MNEPMKDFKDTRWIKLVESFKERIEEDKKYFKCESAYVKLPEICPRPEYCLIGMEPGPGKDPSKEPEYCNFLASKNDFIINYCAYYYLGKEGFNYQITDMAKGGISLKNASNTRSERYKIWLPHLKQELELLGNPKIVFIGKGLSDLNKEESYLPMVPPKNSILHHSPQASSHIKNYYRDNKKYFNFDLPDFNNWAAKEKIKELAAKLMEMNNYSLKLRDKYLKYFSEELTDFNKILLAVYRYDFERFSKP